MLAFVSCVVTTEVIEESDDSKSFEASFATDDTKTVLVNRTDVYWQDGDEISLSGADDPFVTSLTEDSPVALFTGDVPDAEVYYSAYPYDAVEEWADEIVLLHLPTVQPATKGTFAPGVNIAVASTTAEERSFYFKNVMAYVKLAIGSGVGEITSVTISAPGGEDLTGYFYVDCSQENLEFASDETVSYVTLSSDEVFEPGSYYFGILPGTYSEGLTFTFKGPEGTVVKSIERSLTIDRGTIYALQLDVLDWPPVFYAEVDESYDNWTGDYLITYSTGSTIKVFNSFEGSDKGTSSVDLVSKLTADGIPAKDGDSYKAVVTKVGNYYSVNISGLGYIGLESSSNKVHKSDVRPDGSATKYLWTISYNNGGVELANAAFSTRYLLWNNSADCFRCYTGGQKGLTLYRRSSSGGTGTITPDPEPEPEPEPTPDPNPDQGDEEEPDDDQNQDIPQPVPGTSGKYGWYELPQISYTQSGSYMIDSNDKNLYYAHHICAGNEKGPGGKTARNYTVCYSAEHHCPVWVAAPRHKMYQSGASRTNAYAKDPSIPADIQYSSKNTGGGCNKGHMLGSAERISTTATNKQVFYYSNIAPQYSSTFNTGGGGWNTLEDWVDGQVCSDTLYVVIGAYFDKYTDNRGYTGNPATISFGGRSDVHRPTMFYYILLRTKKGNTGKPLSQCSTDEIKCAAFVRSHETPKGTKVSSDELMSVSDLEKVTGFTYFPNVPQAPKSSFKASDWGFVK